MLAKGQALQLTHVEGVGFSDRSVLNYISRGLLRAEKVAVGLDWKYEIDSEELERFSDSRNIPLRPLEL